MLFQLFMKIDIKEFLYSNMYTKVSCHIYVIGVYLSISDNDCKCRWSILVHWLTRGYTKMDCPRCLIHTSWCCINMDITKTFVILRFLNQTHWLYIFSIRWMYSTRPSKKINLRIRLLNCVFTLRRNYPWVSCRTIGSVTKEHWT
jgi:hypothetical protein